MTIAEALRKVVAKQDLTREEAGEVMRAMMSGTVTPVQAGGLLVGLRMKGEGVEEIVGFAETMRMLATRVPARRRPLVDTCGTGGDRSGTFNISTTAAFVVAGAGIAVAKHGNRSATSRCGSADVLEALGVNLDADPERIARSIDEAGIGFLFARALHGAMRHVAAVRTELGMRTIFNILGPLTNPAGACGQVMGVFDGALVEPLAQVLAHLGTRHAFVVAGADGMDELTLAGPSRVAEAVGGRVKTYEITPELFGFDRTPGDALAGGDPAKNARLLRAVLEGCPGPHRDVVLLNAAPAIVAGGKASDWSAGIAAGAASVDSGAALASLESLIRMSHDT